MAGNWTTSSRTLKRAGLRPMWIFHTVSRMRSQSIIRRFWCANICVGRGRWPGHGRRSLVEAPAATCGGADARGRLARGSWSLRSQVRGTLRQAQVRLSTPRTRTHPWGPRLCGTRHLAPLGTMWPYRLTMVILPLPPPSLQGSTLFFNGIGHGLRCKRLIAMEFFADNRQQRT